MKKKKGEYAFRKEKKKTDEKEKWWVQFEKKKIRLMKKKNGEYTCRKKKDWWVHGEYDLRRRKKWWKGKMVSTSSGEEEKKW